MCWLMKPIAFGAASGGGAARPAAAVRRVRAAGRVRARGRVAALRVAGLRRVAARDDRAARERAGAAGLPRFRVLRFALRTAMAFFTSVRRPEFDREKPLPDQDAPARAGVQGGLA